MLAFRAPSLSHVPQVLLPLFPLHDADKHVCMPELHSAASALAASQVDPGAEEALVALPAGLEAEMPILGKHLRENRNKD